MNRRTTMRSRRPVLTGIGVAMATMFGLSGMAVIAMVAGGPNASAAQTTCTPSTGFNTCVEFTYSGAQQTFTVPSGVTNLNATLLGGSGNAFGGRGGQASGTVAVTPGQTLTVTVGSAGSGSSGVAAFGGGAPGGTGCTRFCGASGAGMSALWDGAANVAANALLIAGGAGNNGGGESAGGNGGGTSGGSGAGGGGGGNQTAGGAGGTASGCASGAAGSQFQGGAGAAGFNGGGGGGGGWFGGGGGGCGASAGLFGGGGGGGSSYISGPGVTDGATTAGVNPAFANGQVQLQFNLPTITVTKVVGARADAADQFTVAVLDSTPAVITSATTSGTETTVTSPSAIASVGSTYTITDTMAAGSPDPISAYGASIACTDETTGDSVSTGGTGPWTITVAAPDAYSCTVTNAPVVGASMANLRIAVVGGAIAAGGIVLLGRKRWRSRGSMA